MKKWYKLSLASLVVPAAAAGIAMVSVGCGDTVSIKTPKLNATVEGAGSTATEWWNSVKGTSITDEIAAFNNYLVVKNSGTELQAKDNTSQKDVVKSIELIPATDATKATFTMKVTLNDGFAFTDNKSNVWTSGDVTYKHAQQTTVADMVPVTTVYGAEADATAWLAAITKDATKAKANEIQTLFSSSPALNAIDKVTPTVDKDGKINVTVTLAAGFVFGDGKSEYTAPTPITYAKGTAPIADADKPAAKTTDISNVAGNVSEWFKALGTDAMTKFNAIFNNTNNKITADNLENVYLTQVDGANFSVDVVLKGGSYFTAEDSNVLVIGGFKYTSTAIATPELKASVSATGPQKDAKAWWEATFKNTQDQVKKLNEWLVTPLDNTKVASVTVTNDNADAKFFTVTVTLNGSNKFVGGSASWTSGRIGYTQFTQVATMTPLTTVYGAEADATAWLTAITKDATKAKANEIQALFASSPALNVIDKVTHTVGTDGKITATVTLATGFMFADSTTQFTTKTPITYTKGTTAIADADKPTLNIAQAVTAGSADVNEWLKLQGNDAFAKFGKIFKNTNNKITADNLEGIYITQVDGAKFSIAVVLKANTYFTTEDSNVLVFTGFTYTSTAVPTPALKGTPIVAGQQQNDAEAWWTANFSKKPISDQVAEVNGWLETPLDATKVKSITVKNTADKKGFTVTITLNDTEKFASGQNPNTWTSGTITYTPPGSGK